MNLAWDVARASGIVSWLLLTTSVVWGLLLSTEAVNRRRPGRKWTLDLHRFLGGLAVIFVGVHLVALLLDQYVHFGLTELLVPLASSYRPWAVACGIVGFYLLLAVELTSLLKDRLPNRFWHIVHLGSYLLFFVASVHLLLAGTDAGNALVRGSVLGAVAVVAGLTLWRISRPTKAEKRAARAHARRQAGAGAEAADLSRSPSSPPAAIVWERLEGPPRMSAPGPS